MSLLQRPLHKAEFILLCLFAIALPLVEAPKNIFWAAFLLVWLIRSGMQRNFGNLTRPWDLVFAGLILAPLLSVLNTPYAPQWKEMGDVVGYVSLGWMLARSRLEARQINWLLAALIGATLLGLLHGYWVLATEPKRIWLQLNSVGHVNHSALYGAGIGILAAMQAACGKATAGRNVWWLSLLAAVLMLGAMVAFASRGALVAYVAGALVALLVLSQLSLKRMMLLLGLVLTLGVVAQVVSSQLSQDKNNQSLLQKTLDGMARGNLSSYRVQAFNTAIEMARRYPLTGVGAANFSAVSPAELEGWVRARSDNFQRDDYYFSSHAHGLFANTLGERGLLGITALAALLAGWTIALIRRRPRADTDSMARLCWGAGLAGWAVVFIGGLFNTTLHHEHGMLGMVCLGLLLQTRDTKA